MYMRYIYKNIHGVDGIWLTTQNDRNNYNLHVTAINKKKNPSPRQGMDGESVG